MVDVLNIGGGHASKIRQAYGAYPDAVNVIGVVDTDPDCWYNTDFDGDAPFYTDIDDATDLRPDVVDITTPTETHYDVARAVVERFDADVLLEKPVASPCDIDAFEKLVSEHDDRKWVVNENYRCSGVTRRVHDYAEQHGLADGPVDIRIDFSKHRQADVEDGRYVDEEFGVFGYEGPHMLACVAGTGAARTPAALLDEPTAAPMETDALPADNRQGTGRFAYETVDGSRVELHTSMVGEIGHGIDFFQPPEEIGYGEGTRWRVMELADLDGDVRIMARYEPDHLQDERFQGQVAVDEDGLITRWERVPDSSMDQLLEDAFTYFRDGDGNPSPVGRAAEIVRFLDTVRARL